MGVGGIGVALIAGDLIGSQLPVVKEFFPFHDNTHEFLVPSFQILFGEVVRLNGKGNRQESQTDQACQTSA